MPARPRIRKQVYDLTPVDLQEHPVWVFMPADDGTPDQDDATVAPWDPRAPFDPAEGATVVRARFTLADGTGRTGYLYPGTEPDDDGIRHTQPVIVTERGQVSLWCGTVIPSPDDLERWYAVLGAPASATFPLRFASDVPLRHGEIVGMTEGFVYLEHRRRLLRRQETVRTAR
jgi:hypothetical protein